MTPVEFKTIEGSRVQTGLAAIAALPGAGLVTGSAAGAPLFSAALISVAMAYLFWLYTDNYYYRSVLLKDVGLLEEWRPRLNRESIWVTVGTLVYAGLTVVFTLMGFAGEHTSLAAPISAETGFLVTLGYFVLCAVFVVIVRIFLSRLQSDVNKALIAARETSEPN